MTDTTIVHAEYTIEVMKTDNMLHTTTEMIRAANSERKERLANLILEECKDEMSRGDILFYRITTYAN